MKTATKLILLTIASIIGASFPAIAQTTGSPEAAQKRQHIEQTTQRVLQERGRSMVVTSRHRDDSEAHKRGAIDIRSKDIPRPERHAEARAISQSHGNNHTVIVEERG